MTTAAASRPEPEEVDFGFSRGIDDVLSFFHARRPLALVAFVWAVTWLPLAVLALAQGVAFGPRVDVPLLRDALANARTLVALPCLLLGARFATARLAETWRAFEQTGIVGEADRPRFRELRRRAAARVRSPWTDVAALAVAAATVALLPRPVLARANSWHAWGLGEDAPLTLAGAWLLWVVIPLYRFLLLRWFFRFMVWAAALAQVARFDLRLLPAHPDRAGGLGFVGRSLSAFAPLALALSILVAAAAWNDVQHLDRPVQDLKGSVALFAGVVITIWVAPLIVFLPALVQLKRGALYEHDALAARCDRAFHADWVEGERDARTLLAREDVQSLSSVAHVCDTVRALKPLPLDRVDVVGMVAVTLAPMLPLALSTIPPAELQRLLKVFIA